MKYHLLLNLSLIGAGIAGSIQLSADSYKLSDGTRIEGEIHRAIGESITIVASDGSKVLRDIDDFDAQSKTSINDWKNAHPEKADVYTKWDTQPIIVSSKLPELPEQFLESKFKGSASIELILDESGLVLHASVRDASHEELEEPSIKATKNWKFEPAMVDGNPVKSKLRIPFQFKNTPPEKTFRDHFKPNTPFAL